MLQRSSSRLAAAFVFAFFAFVAVTPAFAAPPAERGYALILADPPVARRQLAREDRQAVRAARASIETAQAGVRAELESRGIQTVTSLQTVLNAVLVRTTPGRIAELRAIPGVVGVIPLRRYRLQLNKALELLQVPAAWNSIGGMDKAGLGVKIAIIDTGIDQTHPGFQDPSLPVPQGFPACLNTTQNETDTGYDCAAFTNNKVIVAKSFVQYLSNAGAATSSPDDYSPRDRVGHGTAVAMCAGGVTNTGNLGPGTENITITGVAPKAYLGSYKVFGSTGTNGFADDASILAALEEAEHDGMNVAVMSLGAPALAAPEDTGAVCGLPLGQPCDAEAAAVENATQMGMTVVIAGGNLGDTGQITPTPGTISTPGIAPPVITVGAVENSHQFSSVLVVPGFRNILDVFSDGPLPSAPISAPLIDVAKVSADQYACSALTANSLNKDFALIERGPQDAPCTFVTKVRNALHAGAIGVVFYDYNDQTTPFRPGGLTNTSIPSVLINNSDGIALQAYLKAHAGATATIDPTIQEAPNPDARKLLTFSSRGPVLGAGAGLKPDVLAVGDNVFMAAQNYDPNGEVYSASRYTVAGGTSFATPMVAGAAALIIGNAMAQGKGVPAPAEVKSRIVNTADPNVTDAGGQPASVAAKGAGIMNAAAAVTDTISISPASFSFGSLSAAALPQILTIINHGTSAVTLQFSVVNDPAATSAGNHVSVNPPSLFLAPGATNTVQVNLIGGVPSAGLYAGEIDVSGPAVPLRVPFIFGAPSATAHYVVNLAGPGFDGTANQPVPFGFAAQFLDQNGFPVPNYPVTWKVTSGDAQLLDNNTGNPAGTTVRQTADQNGIVYIDAKLGTAATDTITVTADKDSSLSASFSGGARPQPTITKFQDSATFTTAGSDGTLAPGIAVSPGSYMTLYGTGLSDVTQSASQLPLPLNIASANVSFDLINVACPPYNDSVNGGRCSFPGRLSYVSPTQVNVLVPWELTTAINQLVASGKKPGCSRTEGICAQVKVYIDQSYGNVWLVGMGLYDPGFFMNGNVVAAEDAENGAILTQSNPAKKKEYVALYCNGLGPVDHPPASGDAAPSTTLVRTTQTPAITIGGVPVPAANVLFSGLAPGYAGLYQVNVQIPDNTPSGSQKITISIGGVTSPAGTIQIQ